jgi:hypothetical protein
LSVPSGLGDLAAGRREDDSASGWAGHIEYVFVKVLVHKKADDGTSGVVGGATSGADGVRNDLLQS